MAYEKLTGEFEPCDFYRAKILMQLDKDLLPFL
jgi:hypothetical protein